MKIKIENKIIDTENIYCVSEIRNIEIFSVQSYTSRFEFNIESYNNKYETITINIIDYFLDNKSIHEIYRNEKEKYDKAFEAAKKEINRIRDEVIKYWNMNHYIPEIKVNIEKI